MSKLGVGAPVGQSWPCRPADRWALGSASAPGQPSPGPSSRSVNLWMERMSEALGVQQRNQRKRRARRQAGHAEERLVGARLSSWSRDIPEAALAAHLQAEGVDGHGGARVRMSRYVRTGVSVCICALGMCGHTHGPPSVSAGDWFRDAHGYPNPRMLKPLT